MVLFITGFNDICRADRAYYTLLNGWVGSDVSG